MATLVRALRRAAFVFRQVAALGALILGVRILWLSAVAGIAHAQSKGAQAEKPTQSPNDQDDRVVSGLVPNTQRPDLDELRSLVEKTSPSEVEIDPPPAVPIQRRILVDVGPARSEVFVGKKNVGMTPFGGQIGCAEGEEIMVQVLPPRGVPIQRRVTCSGDTLLVQE